MAIQCIDDSQYIDEIHKKLQLYHALARQIDSLAQENCVTQLRPTSALKDERSVLPNCFMCQYR
ncbi:hypothetical protein KIN20_032736 [Parelaphostrongylus tenuis]|uniref:Uncharacterized protein n=1 Tax=Parelaphostrongylus tenuis TaxID=148309 RepID=A0AAD5WI89_PARTN|nr:hypothetical protein KIN20_032736 [Parelaphostrongylus tenuis]